MYPVPFWTHIIHNTKYQYEVNGMSECVWDVYRKNIYSNDNSVLIIFVLFKTKDYTKRKKCNENIVIYVGNNLSEILNSGHATTISNISHCSRNLNGKSCFIYVLPVMIYLFQARALILKVNLIKTQFIELGHRVFAFHILFTNKKFPSMRIKNLVNI